MTEVNLPSRRRPCLQPRLPLSPSAVSCRWRALVALAALIGTMACQREVEREPPRTASWEAVNTPVRIAMDELHRAGGVPPGWIFSLPKGVPGAGRQVFVDYGCHTCHAIAGEDFNLPPAELSPGPDLTGMGSHHPAVYFVESILNPDAVLVDGPGYTAEDGLSNMPAYPDLTARELVDLVTYLTSLSDPSGHVHSGSTDSYSGRVDLAQPDLPAATEATPAAATSSKAAVFFVLTYSLRSGQLEALEKWFAATGQPAFRSHDALLELETYIDRTRGPESFVTVFGFADMPSLRAFLAEKRVAQALDDYALFTELADRQIYESRPVYAARSLSSTP